MIPLAVETTRIHGLEDHLKLDCFSMWLWIWGSTVFQLLDLMNYNPRLEAQREAFQWVDPIFIKDPKLTISIAQSIPVFMFMNIFWSYWVMNPSFLLLLNEYFTSIPHHQPLIWRIPKGVLPNHPFIDGVFHDRSSDWGTASILDYFRKPLIHIHI